MRENLEKNHGIALTNKETAANALSKNVLSLLNKGLQTNIGTKIANNAATQGLITALFGEATAAEVAAGSTTSLGAALMTFAGPALAVAAAIAAITGAIYLAYRAYTKDARVMQEAKEAMVGINKV